MEPMNTHIQPVKSRDPKALIALDTIKKTCKNCVHRDTNFMARICRECDDDHSS